MILLSQRKPAVSEVEWVQSRKEKEQIEPPLGGSSKRYFTSTAINLTAVRRVVAPTLSAAIVYNSAPVESSNQRSPLSKGKYAASSSQSLERQIDAATMSPSDRAKSIGKYGPKSSAESARTTNTSSPSQVTPVSSVRGSDPVVPSQPNVTGKYSGAGQEPSSRIEKSPQMVLDVPETTQRRTEETAVVLPEPSSREAEFNAEAEKVVRKTVRRLVRRLPSTQQALLRSRISLPTNWAREIGTCANC